MTSVAIIAREGELADLILGRLSTFCRPIRRKSFAEGVPPEAMLVIIADDKPEETDLYAEEEALRSIGVPWLRVSIASGEAIVGPLVRPGVPGCSLCASTRLLNASMRMSPMDASPELSVAELLKPEAAQAASVMANNHIASLIASEARRLLVGRTPQTGGRLYLVNRRTLRSSLHSFQPDPLCPICGELPDDSPERAAIALAPAPKPTPDTYRLKPLSEWSGKLTRSVFDARTGLINERFRDLQSPFAGSSVHVPSVVWGGELAGGRGISFAGSDTAAMLEGLERHCGKAPQGYRPFVFDSFSRLQADALDPRATGLYSDAQYRQPGFPFEPFDPDAPIEWVWGFSLTREKPILVPRSLAYYSANGGENWVNEGSNGSSIGGSLEEAILHGIFEAVERDAFLMTWNARMPLRQLDPLSSGDKELALMVSRIRAVSGYDMRLYNMTMEHGIPSILAVAKTLRPGRMNLICAAGAHLDPLHAARGAIQEASGLLEGLQPLFEREKDLLLRMLQDSSLVERMEHHVLLYGLPQAEERLSFLLNQRRAPQTFGEAFEQPVRRPELADDVRELVRTFERIGLDIIAVEQTSPEVRRLGLRCVKVLIPGLLPMTFGHALTRLTGLPRALRVPFELGYAAERLTFESLNPHPHPFP